MDREIEVAIAGGHGKIARLLGALLVEQGHSVLGLIRDPAQEDDLHAIGVEPVICDLEADHDVGEAVAGVTPSSSPPALGQAAEPSASAPWTSAARSS